MTKILMLVTLLISNFFIKIVYTIEDNVCHSGSEEDCNISIFDYQDEMDWKNNFEELWDWLNFVKNSDHFVMRIQLRNGKSSFFIYENLLFHSGSDLHIKVFGYFF